MKSTIASLTLMALSNAISLQSGYNEPTLYVRHVSSQEPCDTLNARQQKAPGEELFTFDQDACACLFDHGLYDDMNDCPAPREGSPLEPNKCYLTCSVNEIYNHGLDENCQIPAQGVSELEHGFNGYHSHRLDNEDENCSGRVIHNYSRVEIAEAVEEYSDYEEDYEEVIDEYIEEEEVIEYEEEEVTPTEPEEETYDDNIADEPIVEIEENDATAEPAEETDTVEYEEEITIEEATGNGIDLSENQFFDQYQDQLDQNSEYTYNYNIGYTEVDEFQHSQEEAEAEAAAQEAANQLAYGDLLAGYTSEEPVAAEDFLNVESNQNLIDAVAASTFPEIVETETAFVPETELPSFLRRAYQDANANNDARTRLQEQNQQEQEQEPQPAFAELPSFLRGFF